MVDWFVNSLLIGIIALCFMGLLLSLMALAEGILPKKLLEKIQNWHEKE